MSGERMVLMTAEEAKVLDEVVIPGLMRAKETNRASHLMTLSLKYRAARDIGPQLPENVVAFPDRSGFSRKVQL